MSSIAAPVVPTKDAAIAPMARTTVLALGVALISPAKKSPPETTNNANSSKMNWTYSKTAWPTRPQLRRKPTQIATGTPSPSATPSWNLQFSQ